VTVEQPASDAESLLKLLEAAAQFYADQLADSPVAKRWMVDRGWEGVTAPGPEANRWRAGYAPRAWTTLTAHLQQLGHSDTDIVESGLGLVTRHGNTVDRFRNRLVLPLIDGRGVIGFVGRALPGSGDQAPKWLNPPRTPLYDKGRHLFGLMQNADRWTAGQVPVLVEGPGDAIAVSLAGRAAIALCGAALSGAHVFTLDAAVADGRGLVLAFDGDAAGRAGVDRAWEHLVGRRNVSVVELAGGRDPGTYATASLQAQLRSVLDGGRPLRDVVIDHRLDRWSRVLDNVSGQVDAVRDIANFLMREPDGVAEAISHVARRVGLPVPTVSAVLLDEVPRAVSTVLPILHAGFATPRPIDERRSPHAGIPARPR
jgi:DNA primase catalytic core